MREKRFLLQATVFLVVFLFCFILWNLFCIVSPYPIEVPAYVTHSEYYNFTYPTHLLHPNDYHLLVNYSFKFDILKTDCDDKTLLLVLVHSSPSNFRKRTVIRETWGNGTQGVKVYFIMGRSDRKTIRRMVEEESEIFGDLVQGNFLDTYRNLTYKHLTSFKYAIYHCFGAKYILKTDDDVFVNMPLMKHFLTMDLSKHGVTNLLLCNVKKSSMVLRSYRSKWRVGFEEYPSRNYPPYCPGWVILYSPDVLFTLYRSVQDNSQVFWIDDVYLTGIIAAKNNMIHTDLGDLVLSKRDQKKLLKKNIFPKKPFLFGTYDLKEEEIRILWDSVVAHSVPPSAPMH